MSANERIAFTVETSRILEILASEIYDSPKAFLRENVQNAYDAVLMRCTAQNLNVKDRKITVTLEANRLTVIDDGIGMSETVLKENFWKAGSSGKKGDLAQRSGVIGTFGIGAMANFGVCTALQVETRFINSDTTLISWAMRENLRIAEECVELKRVQDNRPPGTTIIATLDPKFGITAEAVREYLKPYVRFIPVPVQVNGVLISQENFGDAIRGKAGGAVPIGTQGVKKGNYQGTVEAGIDTQGRVVGRLSTITLNDEAISGEIFLAENGGPTLGFRNLFGLAPIPISGHYNFGGFVNLNILHPTAGREALSRDSIQHVSNMLDMIEWGVSKVIADTKYADTNASFQRYINAHKFTEWAKNITVNVLPSGQDIALGALAQFEPKKPKMYYLHRDSTVLHRFATEQSNLIHPSQGNPRRNLQLAVIREMKIPEVPDSVIVEPFEISDLGIEEAMFLLRVRSVLLDDYLIADADVVFATISHGVAFNVAQINNVLSITIARDMPAARMVVECYRTARDVFEGFVKDFVREHLYPNIRNYVPSSTRQGREALFKRLKENKELFRYEVSELGNAEAVLADYLAGKTDFEAVIRASGGGGGGGGRGGQRQEVRQEQVGSVEQVIPDIVTTEDTTTPLQDPALPAPPILRLESVSEMKVLRVATLQAKLNNFQMFLALSDRASRIEGEFLRWPHTTKVMWGSHRVIYVFTNESGDLSLYYDIELKEPLGGALTGGAMFATTTIVTKDRIYVPVPEVLEEAFHITTGAKEFFVRFDTIP